MVIDWPVHVDWTLLHPKPHLWIVHDLTNPVLPWALLDANNDDELYCRTASLDQAIAFARHAERCGDATVDEDSVEFQRMLRLQMTRAWERAQELGEREPAGRTAGSPDTLTPAQAFALGTNRLIDALRDEHSKSERVASNVIPIRRKETA